MRTDFKDYLFRAHSIGKMLGGIPKPLTEKQRSLQLDYQARRGGEGRPLTDKQLAVLLDFNAREKAAPVLNDAAKKFLLDLTYQEMFGRKRSFSNMMTDKGLIREDESIAMYDRVFSIPGDIKLKNTMRGSNEWFTGEWDILEKSRVTDMKTSFKFDTWPKTDIKATDSNYEDQGMVYCSLTKKERYRVAYSLVDTPYEIINSLIFKLDRDYDIFDLNGDVKKRFIDLVVEEVSAHLYTKKGLKEFCHQNINVDHKWFTEFVEIPEELRMKIFDYDLDVHRLEQTKLVVGLAKAYMNECASEIISRKTQIIEVK